MKLLLVFLALCAFSLADNSAIKVDLGKIVGTTLNDPQACRRGEVCLPLVGLAGEGINLRRGQRIFNIPGLPVAAASAALINDGKITATTPDTEQLYQRNLVPLYAGPLLPLTSVPIVIGSSADGVTTTAASIPASFAAGTRTFSSFPAFNGVGDGKSAVAVHYQLGNWLKARATGLIRCNPAAGSTAPFAFVELWFTNLVPQGLYSLHAVTADPAGGVPIPTESSTRNLGKDIKMRTELLAGASASVFTANYDGTAYVYRALPGSTNVAACSFQRAAGDQMLAIDVRHHSNGMVYGAAEEIKGRFANLAGATPDSPKINFFSSAGTTAPVNPEHLTYGLSSHTHLTISFPDAAKDPVLRPLVNPAVSIAAEFVV